MVRISVNQMYWNIKMNKNQHVSHPLVLHKKFNVLVKTTVTMLNVLHDIITFTCEFCTLQSYQSSISELTNWPKTCLCTDVTVHAPVVTINPANGNQGNDLAAWHCKSFIDRLAIIRAAIVKGFSYWCLSTLALKALTSGVKVRFVASSLQTPQPQKKWGKSAFAGLEPHVHAALAVLPLSVNWGKKIKKLGLVAKCHSSASWIDLGSLGM